MIIVKAKNEVRFINDHYVREMELSKIKKSNKGLFVEMDGYNFSMQNVEEIIYADGHQQLRFDGEGKELTQEHAMEIFDKLRKNFIGCGGDPIGPTLR